MLNFDSLTIAENERRFIAQELHDNIAQTLLQLNLQISICKKFLEMGYQTEAQEELDNLEVQIQKGSRQVRNLIADLRIPPTDDGSFDAQLRAHIDSHHKREGAPVTLHVDRPIELTTYVGLALNRIIQEALSNIRKHSQATEAKVVITHSNDDSLAITIQDNGVGFDDALIPNPLAERGGAGIINMAIRAEAIGATFDICAQPENGTTVSVTKIPV